MVGLCFSGSGGFEFVFKAGYQFNEKSVWSQI